MLQAQITPYESPSWPLTEPLPGRIHKLTEPQTDISLKSEGQESIQQDLRLAQIWLRIDEPRGYRLTLEGHDLSGSDRIFIRFPVNSGFMGPITEKNFGSEATFTTDVIFESLISIEWVQSAADPATGDVQIRSVTGYIKETLQKSTTEHLLPIQRTRENPTILVTGYWPPTNEMIRQFSQNPELNPDGWAGDDWEGRGYDIVSYFPTFDIPDCGDCGKGNGDLEVDYQDTSVDFWNISDDVQPIAIITFSRGWIDHSWELEWNLVNRTNWISDYLPPNQPTPNPPDQEHPAYLVRNSDLPLDSIVTAITAANLGLDSYVDWNGNAGMFLSEFMGYHGTWYRGEHPYGDFPCLAAGHIHVGGQIDWDTARTAAEITIRQLTNYLDQFIYTPGDANDDGVINVQDLVIIVNYILGLADPDTVQFYAVDINNDSIINVLDIIIILNMIIGD